MSSTINTNIWHTQIYDRAHTDEHNKLLSFSSDPEPALYQPSILALINVSHKNASPCASWLNCPTAPMNEGAEAILSYSCSTSPTSSHGSSRPPSLSVPCQGPHGMTTILPGESTALNPPTSGQNCYVSLLICLYNNPPLRVQHWGKILRERVILRCGVLSSI